ncbi:Sec-independent protein translocase protein TatA [Polymorphobacter multimanifer]|uniref:Sec-independent protein translocase protein TatA n=1 Tax=Polymorphobacter multimanifer TaxID=1070431 RepID=A0A841L349_9SPHN|nr:twin-arginine translocase TatA/TatE family subunit [Polymorphobacter multimanifer]MBB6227087.1 sec-independent protein translocase protein TatA [Polymorphobacter multimanifer]GGI70605.1 Sec-independent protein translocase protein TatA [Polymorphobacter multimanifer]
MGSFSLIHWVVLILVVILLFGRGRISDLMGDFAKGINSFKKGLADDDSAPATPKAPPAQLTDAKAGTVTPTPTAEDVRR